MIPDHIKKRLIKNRVMTSVAVSIPKDVLDDLDDMAPRLGFPGHQELIRSYVSEGMRRDERKIHFALPGEKVSPLKTKDVESAIAEKVLIDAIEPLRAVG